jgi:hypothetical protein
MPVKYVQVLHDDGRWYVAELLDQHRSGAAGGPWCGTRWRRGCGTSAASGPTTCAGRTTTRTRNLLCRWLCPCG